jgi:tRNA-dihydrouridine synthase B
VFAMLLVPVLECSWQDHAPIVAMSNGPLHTASMSASAVKPLQLGPVTVATPAIQGALSGYSDLPMRRVARAFGCGYTMNEVVLDELVVLPGKLQAEILRVEDDDHPVGGQILGATPDTFAAAATLMVDAGYDVIDINFGCPVKKTVGHCRGGYLLSEPRIALEIISRVRNAVRPEVPVTLKMRRGIDDSAMAEEMFWEIIEGAFARGIEAVCVHGRTVEQRYVGPSRPSFLTRVKQRFPQRTILGSGDVFTAAAAVEMLHTTSVDAAWVARGAIGAPWVFGEIAHLLRTGVQRPPPSFTEQRRAVWMHREQSVLLYGEVLGNRIFRSAAIKYAEAHPRCEDVKQAFYRCKTAVDVDAAMRSFYDIDLADDHFGEVIRKLGSGALVAAGATA